MYNETLKFQFNENISSSYRLAFLAELFKTLEAQSIEFSQLESGGVPTYKIKGNGKVVLYSFFPASTELIRRFIKTKRAENIIK